MRAVFVTGGSGFLGGALLDALSERGEDVRALARSEAAAARGVARAGARRGGGRPAVAGRRRVNRDGRRPLPRAARWAGVPRLVLISTEQAVLGDRPLVSADESAPYPRRYVGPYAATKAEAEQLVL